MTNKRSSMIRTAVVLAVGAFAIVAFAACGDDAAKPAATVIAPTAAVSAPAAASGEAANVEKTIRAAYDAWNAKDTAKLLPYFTDKGLVAVIANGAPDATADSVKAMLAATIGAPKVSTNGFKNTKVTGATATTDSAEVQNTVLGTARYSLINVGGAWKVDGQEWLETEVPAGVPTVHLDLNEFAFVGDTTKFGSGSGAIAVSASNVGTQRHELAMAKIPADAVIDDLLKSDANVPGFEFQGVIGPIEPGKSNNLVFTEALTPGRYVMVCFLPDTTAGGDGTPHALKGMIKEFTVK